MPEPPTSLRRVFDLMLSNDVRPVLRAHGFTKKASTFRRRRGALYDMINFQGNKWNDPHQQVGFFVNVGIGSTEIDVLGLDNDYGPSEFDYMIDRRMEQLIAGLPAELRLDRSTDRAVFADELIGYVEQIVTALDAIATTHDLLDNVMQRNGLHKMEKTCRYLAYIGDTESLANYVTRLHDRFADDHRWEFFSRRIRESVDEYGVDLAKLDLV